MEAGQSMDTNKNLRKDNNESSHGKVNKDYRRDSTDIIIVDAEKVRAENVTLRKRYKQLESESAKLQDENHEMEDELTECRSKIKQLGRSVVEKNKRIAEMYSSIDSLLKENEKTANLVEKQKKGKGENKHGDTMKGDQKGNSRNVIDRKSDTSPGRRGGVPRSTAVLERKQPLWTPLGRSDDLYNNDTNHKPRQDTTNQGITVYRSTNTASDKDLYNLHGRKNKEGSFDSPEIHAIAPTVKKKSKTNKQTVEDLKDLDRKAAFNKERINVHKKGENGRNENTGVNQSKKIKEKVANDQGLKHQPKTDLHDANNKPKVKQNTKDKTSDRPNVSFNVGVNKSLRGARHI